VLSKESFWNSVEYRNSYGSEFTSAEFRGIFHYLIPRNSVFFSYTEFLILNLSGKFIQETVDFFVLKTEVELKSLNFAYVCLNDPFVNNLCLKNGRNKKKLKSYLTFLWSFLKNSKLHRQKCCGIPQNYMELSDIEFPNISGDFFLTFPIYTLFITISIIQNLEAKVAQPYD
jgi:hypothetical protein